MLIKIQTSIKADGNKGSSYALATYLEKYDVEKEKNSLEQGKLPEARSGFFDHTNDNLTKSEVVNAIDTNKKGLGKKDCKFYALTIAPSSEELKHIIKNITQKSIKNLSELNPKELEKLEEELKNYTRAIMDSYAAHFKRKGLNKGTQLVYAGKVEHFREYKGTDDLVTKGIKKVGDKKPGLNTHIHVIVARKDSNMKYKLSPLANEKGSEKNSILNGKKVQRGFDRTLFSIKAEAIFDATFGFNREIENKVIYKIEASKNNDTEIKIEKDPELKQDLQKKLINNFIKFNNYEEELLKLSLTHKGLTNDYAKDESISDIDKKRKQRKFNKYKP
ncbi:DUF5712 family protein [Cellulophaga fucicola]|uniref:DUF5712 family protein n=1 Tax=Cellulophaga fucicola TaxID=76595 RepID=UPI003EBE37BE